MANQTSDQRKEYYKKYCELNKEKLRVYHKEYHNIARPRPEFKISLHPDTKKVLRSLPNPFGTFEKAKYTCRIKHKKLFFTTTCRNTEDCVEIMKLKFIEVNDYAKEQAAYCSIYKIQHGIRKLIFREIV